jgi:hypothetical protein
LSFARAVPIALVLALAAPAVAHADATLSLTGTAPHKTLTFTVNDALNHRAELHLSLGDLVIYDTGIPIAVGASGCTAIVVDVVDCGPVADFESVVFAFSDGDDTLDVPSDFPIVVSADGGAGNDILVGGARDDELRGGPGDDLLYGRPGQDALVGGSGDDVLAGNEGVDAFDGGQGDDDLYAAETPAAADAAIACGDGEDLVVDYDDDDPIDGDCETTDPPYLDGDLQITGEPRVGNVLGLSLPTNTGGEGEVTFAWERCDASGVACRWIDDADGPTYTPTVADVGRRLRAWYGVENGLGDDAVESDVTDLVLLAEGVGLPTPGPWTSWPRGPRPPGPRVAVPNFVIPPVAFVRKPSFAVRNGDPIVDTGRATHCPGSAGGTPCRLKVTARPAGTSARVHGRPASAGEASVLVAGGKPVSVRVPLNLRAYRMLRAHGKLTLSVTATITRLHSARVQTTFAITVKLPPHKRR